MPDQFTSPEGDLEDYFVTDYWLINQYIGNASLWGWGNSTNGAVGDNNTTVRSLPAKAAPETTNIDYRSVDGGNQTGAATKRDGTLWTWGNNANGQIGDNTITNKLSPVTTFSGRNNWRVVNISRIHCTAIKTDGTLWIWGSPANGRLGNAVTVTNRSTPVTTFAGGTNWKDVVCGDSFTSAVKEDGTLWLWGDNSYGQIGNANASILGTVSPSTPVTTFAGGTNWKYISCGYDNIAVIKTDGTLWTWGRNTSGRNGNATIDTTDRSTPITTFSGGTSWKQVSIGSSHAAAIKTDGTLWMWGLATNGVLGNAITAATAISTPVTTFYGGTNWKQVGCGRSHTAALQTDGSVWCWGYGPTGALANGAGAGSSRSTPSIISGGIQSWISISVGRDTVHAIEIQPIPGQEF